MGSLPWSDTLFRAWDARGPAPREGWGSWGGSGRCGRGSHAPLAQLSPFLKQDLSVRGAVPAPTVGGGSLWC